MLILFVLLALQISVLAKCGLQPRPLCADSLYGVAVSAPIGVGVMQYFDLLARAIPARWWSLRYQYAGRFCGGRKLEFTSDTR